ncbi:MAG: dTDP-4-dehydrorhamnose 3,5-epimerase [Oscillospiraceae bacterium]
MGNFKFIATEVPGLVVIEPAVFGDDRGFFMETWHQAAFEEAGIRADFVQDNHSKSRRGVLRGLHFQWQNTQGKLVRVVRGRVFDVGVDLRPGSPHFGRWAGAELSEENRRQFYVPPGFGHGFLVLSDEAEFTYKCTDFYNPAAEGGIRWDDADIGIKWPDVGAAPLLSEKDAALPGFSAQDFTPFERWVTP